MLICERELKRQLVRLPHIIAVEECHIFASCRRHAGIARGRDAGVPLVLHEPYAPVGLRHSAADVRSAVVRAVVDHYYLYIPFGLIRGGCDRITDEPVNTIFRFG